MRSHLLVQPADLLEACRLRSICSMLRLGLPCLEVPSLHAQCTSCKHDSVRRVWLKRMRSRELAKFVCKLLANWNTRQCTSLGLQF